MDLSLLTGRACLCFFVTKTMMTTTSIARNAIMMINNDTRTMDTVTLVVKGFREAPVELVPLPTELGSLVVGLDVREVTVVVPIVELVVGTVVRRATFC